MRKFRLPSPLRRKVNDEKIPILDKYCDEEVSVEK